jgi:hypothetical protein
VWFEQDGKQRVVRVFLSSTFTDTVHERAVLLRCVHPAVQRYARKLNFEVVFSEMRFGIRKSLSDDNKTSEVCMAELERCFEGTATTFVGYLAGEELAAAYASGDAFVFPSSTETLGLVLLEAMAAGCPVVGARRGGIPDIVSDGINGCLLSDVQRWHSALGNLALGSFTALVQTSDRPPRGTLALVGAQASKR